LLELRLCTVQCTGMQQLLLLLLRTLRQRDWRNFDVSCHLLWLMYLSDACWWRELRVHSGCWCRVKRVIGYSWAVAMNGVTYARVITRAHAFARLNRKLGRCEVRLSDILRCHSSRTTFDLCLTGPFSEDHPRLSQFPPPRRISFESCWCEIFQPGYLPVTRPTVSMHWMEYRPTSTTKIEKAVKHKKSSKYYESLKGNMCLL